jgi:hypothetical protein
MSNLFIERYEAARTKRLASEHGTKIPEFTVGDLMDAIWSVDNDEDARAFFEGHVADIQRQIDGGTWDSRYDAVSGARANIGWMFGEGMSQERINMWTRVTQSAHPVFGSMATRISPEEAFQQGKDMARRRIEAEDRTN